MGETMKEKLYTIPLNDAVNANDECPLCFSRREIENDQLDYVLGSCASYMESDMRDKTDEAGFCQKHFQDMFDFGNTLGNGWILKTHYLKVISELENEFKNFSPNKLSFGDKLKGKKASNSLVDYINKRNDSCFICREVDNIFQCYIDTFFYLYKNDSEFKEKIKNGKGFCLTHFGNLCEAADVKLSADEQKEFYSMMSNIMVENFKRMQEDVSWLVDKFNYQNHDKDWKNSKDAVQRGMQKLKGGYPAEPKLKMNK